MYIFNILLNPPLNACFLVALSMDTIHTMLPCIREITGSKRCFNKKPLATHLGTASLESHQHQSQLSSSSSPQTKKNLFPPQKKNINPYNFHDVEIALKSPSASTKKNHGLQKTKGFGSIQQEIYSLLSQAASRPWCTVRINGTRWRQCWNPTVDGWNLAITTWDGAETL